MNKTNMATGTPSTEKKREIICSTCHIKFESVVHYKLQPFCAAPKMNKYSRSLFRQTGLPAHPLFLALLNLKEMSK